MIVYDNTDLLGLVFRKTGSLLFSPNVLLSTLVSSVICVVVFQFPDPVRLPEHLEWPAWVYSTVLAFAIIFRTSLAYGRFWGGITSTVTMLSLWRSAYVNLMSFVDASILEHQANGDIDNVAELMESKGRLLHWFSLLFAVAIQTLQWREEPDPLRPMPQNEKEKEDNRGFWAPLRDLERCDRIYILADTSRREREYIEAAFDKLTHVIYWIEHEISYLHLFKRLLIGSPILTRVFEELSNGTLAYCEAHTIAFIPFPFLFAQVLSYALYVFVLLCPFICQASLNESEIGGLRLEPASWPSLVMMNVLLVAGFACLNELAIELEDPFREKHNNFPLRVLQRRMDLSIAGVALNYLPRDFDLDSFGEASMTFQLWCETKTCEMALACARDLKGTTEPGAARTAATSCEDLRRSVSNCVQALERDSMNLWRDMRRTELELCGLAFRILASDGRSGSGRQQVLQKALFYDASGHLVSGELDQCAAGLAKPPESSDVGDEHCPGRPPDRGNSILETDGEALLDALQIADQLDLSLMTTADLLDGLQTAPPRQASSERSANSSKARNREQSPHSNGVQTSNGLQTSASSSDERSRSELNLRALLRKSAVVNGRMAPLLMKAMCFDRR